jgi:hypothetical protein
MTASEVRMKRVETYFMVKTISGIDLKVNKTYREVALIHDTKMRLSIFGGKEETHPKDQRFSVAMSAKSLGSPNIGLCT